MRIGALLLCLLFSLSAQAKGIPGAQQFGRTCNGGGAFCYGVPIAPKRTFSFMGSIPNGFTFSRASAANYFNASGNLVSAAIDAPRYDYGSPGSSTLQGLLIEAGATNLVLWNRDLTNPVWTQVTATVALDQTGIDNAANTASSFLALGANSTVCQVVTQAATNAVFSVYLKRLTGTGNVAISQDGGASYTTVTLTGSWKRFQHVNQSTLNPGVCIRLATNTDQIAVDYAQLENETSCLSNCNYASSPILSTTPAGTRSGDGLSMPVNSPTGTTDAVGLWFNKNSGAFVAEWKLPYANLTANISWFGIMPNAFSSDGMSVSLNNGNIEIPTGAGPSCGSAGAFGNVVMKTGATYGKSYFRLSCNGSSTGIGTANPLTTNAVQFMTPAYARKLTYWNYPLTTAQLVAQTQ